MKEKKIKDYICCNFTYILLILILLIIIIFAVVKKQYVIFVLILLTLAVLYIFISCDSEKNFDQEKIENFDEKYLSVVSNIGMNKDMDKSNDINIDEKKNNKTFDLDACQIPTLNNPFMNLLSSDLSSDKEKLPACKIDDHDGEMTKLLNDKIFKDPNDIYNRGHTQRMFYTMPVTTITNDQKGFAEWLYKSTPTCKEDPTKCAYYENLKYNK